MGNIFCVKCCKVKLSLIAFCYFYDIIELSKEVYKEIIKWNVEQTKEARFLPNLQKDYIQIGFILNMESKEVNELIKGDIFRLDFDKEILKSFVVPKVYNHFINDVRDDFFTNRESAIIFGIPSNFIEGILVGRDYEKNTEKLDYIKNKLSNCYICNLDGKVIRE